MPEDFINSRPAEDRAIGEPGAIWTGNFILLCFSSFALLISLQMLIPTLPVYLLAIGGGQRDVGYMMGVYTISAMLMRPVAGCLLDDYGRKKILFLSLVAVLAVTLLYKLASGVVIMMIVRALHGLAAAMAGTAMVTIVADSVPKDRLGEGMGYFGLTSTISLAFAPMVGFWLVGISGYQTLFVAVTLVTVLALSFSLPIRGAGAYSSDPVRTVRGVCASLLEKTALPASVVTFFLTTAYSAVLSFIPLYGVELGIGNTGLFFAANSVTMLIFRPLAGRWADRGGAGTVLLVGHLTMMIGMASVGLSHNILGFVLAGAIIGFGFGFCVPTLQALSLRHAPAERRGAATGTYYIAFDLGLGLGTILWGYVAEAAGYQLMFYTTLAPLVLAGAIYWKIRKKDAEDSKINFSNPFA
ncbi:MAG: Bicyclomycin resistance protein [Pelotomaculum sp. PtaB.Bin104]|nr:MAG: Bicyclomycin resistance protein [Pelotomaculum sp. PtaB.Bin104]